MVIATEMDGDLEYDLDCACSCSECKLGNHNGCEFGSCWLTSIEID